MQTVQIDGKTYRLHSDVLGAEGQHQDARDAFAELGITGFYNALAPRRRNYFEQVFILSDGSAMLADSRISSQVSRKLAEKARA